VAVKILNFSFTHSTNPWSAHVNIWRGLTNVTFGSVSLSFICPIIKYQNLHLNTVDKLLSFNRFKWLIEYFDKQLQTLLLALQWYLNQPSCVFG